MLPDKATFSDYGGAKNDYAAPEDPTTDRSAAEMNPAFADTAAMTRMIPRAWVDFQSDGTVTAHDAVWGNGLSVIPTVTPVSAGVYTVVFPSSVVDALAVSHAVNLSHGWANVPDEGVGLVASVTPVGPITFRVVVLSVIDAAYEDTGGSSITLWVM